MRLACAGPVRSINDAAYLINGLKFIFDVKTTPNRIAISNMYSHKIKLTDSSSRENRNRALFLQFARRRTYVSPHMVVYGKSRSVTGKFRAFPSRRNNKNFGIFIPARCGTGVGKIAIHAENCNRRKRALFAVFRTETYHDHVCRLKKNYLFKPKEIREMFPRIKKKLIDHVRKIKTENVSRITKH